MYIGNSICVLSQAIHVPIVSLVLIKKFGAEFGEQEGYGNSVFIFQGALSTLYST